MNKQMNIPFDKIIATFNKLTNRNINDTSPISVGIICLYLPKALKVYGLEMSTSMESALICMDSNFDVCIKGVLGICTVSDCTDCMEICTIYPKVWNSWKSQKTPQIKNKTFKEEIFF